MHLALIVAALVAATPAPREHPCDAHGGAYEGVSNYRLRTFTLVCADGYAYVKPMRHGARYRRVEPGEMLFSPRAPELP